MATPPAGCASPALLASALVPAVEGGLESQLTHSEMLPWGQRRRRRQRVTITKQLAWAELVRLQGKEEELLDGGNTESGAPVPLVKGLLRKRQVCRGREARHSSCGRLPAELQRSGFIFRGEGADQVPPHPATVPEPGSPSTVARSRAGSSSPSACLRRRQTFTGDSLKVRAVPAASDEGFCECARLIAKDVPRTFPGHPRVDQVRLLMADVLRAYARRDQELGYVQGMCFAAAGACLGSRDLSDATRRFEALMAGLRVLWMPSFPVITVGLPVLEELLRERDPDLLEHMTGVGLDLLMVIPGAWLSLLAKWLPLEAFLEVLPFVGKEGLTGLLAATLLILLYHRSELVRCRGMEEALECLARLATKPPPERLLEMCEAALPKLHPRLRGGAGRGKEAAADFMGLGRLGRSLAAAALGGGRC